jgi:hypothetical protein
MNASDFANKWASRFGQSARQGTNADGGNRNRAAKALTVNGGTPDMSAGDFANKWASRFGQSTRQATNAGGGTSTSGH